MWEWGSLGDAGARGSPIASLSPPGSSAPSEQRSHQVIAVSHARGSRWISPLGREHPPAPPSVASCSSSFPAMAQRCGARGTVTALAESLGKRPQCCSQPRAGAGSSPGTRAALGGSVPAVGRG